MDGDQTAVSDRGKWESLVKSMSRKRKTKRKKKLEVGLLWNEQSGVSAPALDVFTAPEATFTRSFLGKQYTSK